MQITSFEDDMFSLAAFADRLEKFINVERRFVEGSLVLALNSRYGSGKSTFLRMWKNSIEEPVDLVDRPVVVTLNAWESDFYGDPLFSIISSLIETTMESGDSPESLIRAVKSLGWYGTAIGGQVVKKFTGVDAVAAGDYAEKKTGKDESKKQILSDAFSVFKGRKTAMEEIKKSIKELVENTEPYVLFMVDELDRCRPDYAITYLETIKHIFDFPRAVFILAADRRQLENSARTSFGTNLDFEEYYRKFVHREISLPSICESGYTNIVGKYTERYLKSNEFRVCVAKLDGYRIKEITELIAGLKLTPRQIQEVFRLLGHLCATELDKKQELHWCLTVCSSFMSVMKVSDSSIFALLGAGLLPPRQAVEFFRTVYRENEQSIEYWVTLLYTGGGLYFEPGTVADEVLAECGPVGKGVAQDAKSGGWRQGWGGSGHNRFAQAYEKLEQISRWA
jgi:hypothetical protein